MEPGTAPPPATRPAGAAVHDTLRLRRFEGFPSSEHFLSVIEPANVPAVFVGAVKDWEACSLWDPRDGGLDYLLENVGSKTVEAMLSRSAPIFYGDLRSHERVPIPLSSFISACKSSHRMGGKDNPIGVQELSDVLPSISGQASSDLITVQDSSDMQPMDDAQTSMHITVSEQLYLAQVPILSIENKSRSPLENLSKDIKMPIFIEGKSLTSINFWMNNAFSRSSTHYDPHHNLLCVVAGCKHVVLWSPSASHVLYPMPVYGEASNHSSVDLQGSDFSLHSRAKYATDYCQKIILHAGDVLFMPEGWFHQVDSEDLTIAVNFWWESNVMSSMLHHMDAYYLRLILNRLVDKEKNRILNGGQEGRIKARGGLQGTDEASEGHDNVNHNDDSKEGKNENEELILSQMEPAELHALHSIVSIVHDTMNGAGQNQYVHHACPGDGGVGCKENHEPFGNDHIANILWSLKPLALQKVLRVMVHSFPRTLEALILHMLSPISAEVLTQKFDEMDQQTTKWQQDEFYKSFYSVFDDAHAAMNSILNGKESFAFEAFRDVLDRYLRVNISKQE